MSRRVLVVLPVYATLGWALWIFTKSQVAPCLGLDNTTCYAAWMESRSLPDRLLDTPFYGLLLFLALTAITVWLRPPRRTEGDAAG